MKSILRRLTAHSCVHFFCSFQGILPIVVLSFWVGDGAWAQAGGIAQNSTADAEFAFRSALSKGEADANLLSSTKSSVNLDALLGDEGRIIADQEINSSVDFTGYSVTLDPENGPVFTPSIMANEWNPVGFGLNGDVICIFVDGNDIYLGGNFTDAGGNPDADRIVRWDGANWHALGSGLSSFVFAIYVDQNNVIYAGGEFTNVGGDPNAKGIVAWNGSVWTALGSGITGRVSVITGSQNGNIYVGGTFINAGGNNAADYIACWNGSVWSGVGSGMNNYVLAIVPVGNALYVGGFFTDAGGNTAADRIALWDGFGWNSVGTNISNGGLHSIVLQNSEIYIAGTFTDAGGNPNADRIARWNGVGWQAFGTGISNFGVYKLALSGNQVFVAGAFSDAGGNPNADRIAWWNGSSWQGLGTGLNNQARDLAFSGPDLYVVGSFIDAGGNPNADRIARWGEAHSAPYCASFTDLSTPGELLSAATCLCSNGYITPQNYAPNNTYGVNPDANIYRADLAKLVYFALYKGNPPAPADNFPVPFVDLQQSGDPYYRYAKALSYLQYQDDVTPFDRDFVNFRPYDFIERRYALKVLLEAWNIPPDMSDGGTILGLTPADDAYGYVHKAYDMGLVTTGSGSDNMIRGDMFLVLNRLLNFCGGTCNPDCLRPNPQPSDYFVPGNLTPFNLARSIGMAEGYFQPYSETSFNIPGIQLPLTFSHSYNSYLTELPTPYLPVKPLGTGWTHSYNAFVFKAPGWSENNQTIHDKWFVFWPGGAYNCYDAMTLAPETDGVFDEFFVLNSTNVKIKKKNQMEFVFERYQLAGGQYVYLLKQIKDRNNNTITITNEMAVEGPRIDKVTGTNGHILEFSYAAGSNFLASVQDLSGDRTVYFSVDAAGNLASFTNAAGRVKTFGYGDHPGRHLLHSIALPEGNVISNTYTGRKLAQVNYPGVPPLTVNVQPSYGQPTALTGTITDQTGTNIINRFNGAGYPVQREINGQSLNFERNSGLDPSFVSGASYGTLNTGFSYDAKGNLLAMQLPDGVTHTFTYNAANDVLTYKNPRNHTTTYTYDTAGNLDLVTDNLGMVTDFTVQPNGLIASTLNQEGIQQSFQYNSLGYLTRVDLPLGIRSLMDYDTIGRLTQVTNPLDQVSEFEYDALDQVTQNRRLGASPGDEIATAYGYNLNDKLTTITNALGHATTMSYNDREELDSLIFGNDTKQFEYYEDGLLKKVTKPDGTMLQYTYDPLGRLLSDGYTNYTYDNNDNITSIQKIGGLTATNTYDILNRLSTVIYDGYPVAYTYDANNNVTKITYPGGFEVNYAYDANDRLQSVQWGNKSITYTYLNDGRLQQVNMPNGTYRKYLYDAAGRQTGMAELRSATDTICAYTFTLDLLGNHLAEHKTEPLCEPVIPTTNRSSAYNAENEILTSGATNFTHDANGNRTIKDSIVYTWDLMDKLTGLGNNTYQYDGTGLRRWATRSGVLKKYIWDVRGMGNILAETDAAGNIAWFYIHGLGLEARVNAATGAAQYYHSDFRGSIIAMTDSAKVVTHRYSYLPFGEIAVQDEKDPNPFKFVGKYGVMDEGDSIYYMRARYMDAVTGRFLSEDPVWADNLYPYAGNNPVNLYDINGKSPEVCGENQTAYQSENFDYVQSLSVNWASSAMDAAFSISTKSIKSIPIVAPLTVFVDYAITDDEDLVLGKVIGGAVGLFAGYACTSIATPVAGVVCGTIISTAVEDAVNYKTVNPIPYLEQYYGKSTIGFEQWTDGSGEGSVLLMRTYYQFENGVKLFQDEIPVIKVKRRG
jgi:RHS repeat-associated protein